MFENIRRWLEGAAGDNKVEVINAVSAVGEQEALHEYRAGLAAIKAGQFDIARPHFERAIAVIHDLPEAHFYLGLIHRAKSELEDAADCLLMAVTFKPDLVEAWLYLGAVAHERRQYDQAREYFETTLRWRPDYDAAYNGLGKVAEDCGRYKDAAAYYRKAIETNPHFAMAYNNLAYVTLRGELDDEAASTYVHKALELNPDLSDAYRTQGQILQFQGRCHEAVAACNEALRLGQDEPNTRMLLALAQLMLGDFEAGWRNHEARKHVYPIFRTRKLPYPEWDGSALAGRRILIYHEQGIGDEIMFASCMPDLLAQKGECVIECSAKLERLFRRSFPGATVIVADQTSSDVSYLAALPACDWQVAAGSLPGFFRRSWRDFPQHRGYLIADTGRVDYWKKRLRELGPGRKLGVCWRGGAYHTNQARRSLDLDQLLPLLRVPGMEFVSLQYTDCGDEIAGFTRRHGIALHHWQEAIDDYDETAALVSALDQVVSVQTAVIHLAGALGKPAWVLVPATAEWRYLAEGERMPWYPSVRLFRQLRGQSWEPVINLVAGELTRIEGAGT